MRTIFFLLYKEFRQIFRNKALLPIIFVAPIIQLIILAYAANFEVKNLKLYVVDHDQSSVSRRLVGKFSGSPYFQLVGNGFSLQQANVAVEQDQADMILEIPSGFERNLFRSEPGQLHLTANAIDGTKGGLATAYGSQVIREFRGELMETYGSKVQSVSLQPQQASRIGITFSNWFNPELDYKVFMVPGILAMLVTMIGGFLSSMNIVKEKEMGTIEQINVTPIKKYQFVVGKLLPFWVLAMGELAFGLVVAKLLYDVPFVGSVGLLFGVAAIYLLVVLGLGLLISTITETQQQAMFISWFFMVIFIFLSGLFTPIENMPDWAQGLTYFNPVRYFIEVLRMVMLKGAMLADVTQHILILSGAAIGINALAVWNYRKQA